MLYPIFSQHTLVVHSEQRGGYRRRGAAGWRVQHRVGAARRCVGGCATLQRRQGGGAAQGEPREEAAEAGRA